MELGLKGKAVLITGATRGIGADIASGFAEEGARVAICARTKADLDTKAGEISRTTGTTVIGVPVDLSKRGEPERLVQEVVDRFGRLDVLVNSAGVAPGGGVEEVSDDDWERGIQLKLLGLIRCSRAVIPVMRRQGGGRIVNVVGNDGNKCAHWEIVPAVCCAGEQIFTKTLAEQYGRQNILINAINPGPVATERWDELVAGIAKAHGISVADAQKKVDRSVPLGRIARPEEVADVAVFVASERASFMNGALILLDGGQRKALME